MPRRDDPDEFDAIALKTDELETVGRIDDVDDNAVTGARHAREVILPFDHDPAEAITQPHRAAHEDDEDEATLSGASTSPAEDEPPPYHAIPPAAGSAPPATMSEPEPPTPMLTSMSDLPQPAPAPDDLEEGPPSWVVDYLLLCAVLTVVGLVVLYLQHRLLGRG
jgi:hypothetical protein